VAGIFKKGGADIYGKKLFFRAPLFPVFCNLIRKLSGNENIQLFALPQLRVSRFRAFYFKKWFHHQPFSSVFYIAYKQLPMILPSFIGSIMIVIGTIVLARQYSRVVALWAGLIIAFCPVDIFAASRVMPDAIMTAFLLWCFIFFKTSLEPRKNKIIFLSLAFIMAAAAVYTKESAALIIAGSTSIVACKNKNKIIFLTLACFAIFCVFPWSLALYKANGQWLPKAYWQSLSTAQWYRVTSRRDFFFHLYEPFKLYPIMMFSAVYFISLFQKKMWWQNIFFSVPAVTLILMTLLRANEFRQILPAYPFLAVAAACGLEKLRGKINQKFMPVAGVVIVLLLIIVSAVFAFQKSSPSIFGNAGDIFI